MKLLSAFDRRYLSEQQATSVQEQMKLGYMNACIIRNDLCQLEFQSNLEKRIQSTRSTPLGCIDPELWRQCTLKLEQTDHDNINFNMSARIGTKWYNNWMQKPFILKQDFEYVLFMDYYQCTCLNLTPSEKIGSVVTVEIV